MRTLDNGLIDNAEAVIVEWESCGGEASSYITEVIAGFSALKRELAAAQSALSRFEQAALPEEPERLTMTRKLASGGVATETVVAAHHYDALHIRLARYEAAGRELPEELEIMTVDVIDEVSGIESAQPFIHAYDHEKLRDAFIAQKVRANENERDAKSWRDFIKQVKAAQASEETSVIDAAIKEQA